MQMKERVAPRIQAAGLEAEAAALRLRVSVPRQASTGPAQVVVLAALAPYTTSLALALCMPLGAEVARGGRHALLE